MADAIARTLVEMGVSVLSGLAEGLDTAAHLAALDAGGRTVALIVTGIRRQYPPQAARSTTASPRRACCCRSSGRTRRRESTPS
jgi:DNA processing protein